MKTTLLSVVVLSLVLMGCNNGGTAAKDLKAGDSTVQTQAAAPKADPSNIEGFWTLFQAAVKAGGPQVAELTLFPLAGGDFMNEAFDGKPIPKEVFLQHCGKVFDATVKQKVLDTPAGKLEKTKVDGLDGYQLVVSFVSTEGSDKTESQIMFSFAKKQDKFQLVRIDVAG
jgi:hypothetical protein